MMATVTWRICSERENTKQVRLGTRLSRFMRQKMRKQPQWSLSKTKPSVTFNPLQYSSVIYTQKFSFQWLRSQSFGTVIEPFSTTRLKSFFMVQLLIFQHSYSSFGEWIHFFHFWYIMLALALYSDEWNWIALERDNTWNRVDANAKSTKTK